MTTPSVPGERTASRANVALGIAVLSVLLYVVAMAIAQDEDTKNWWLWPAAGLTGAVAAVAGWRAGAPRPRGRALAATVSGGLVFTVILAWIVVAAISGDL